MKILFLGDIFAKAGRQTVKEVLPNLKEKVNPDVVIANVENIRHGSGVSIQNLEDMREYGIDFFTSGNHIFDNKEVYTIMKDKNNHLIRPANYPVGTPGNGFDLFTTKTGKKVLIINLLGRVFIKENTDCPFRKADEILDRFKDVQLDAIFVDFHAEATAEKVALGFYLDGRVSAVIGTHTHIATADARILPKGTAYQSDVGFVGAYNSVIGLDTDSVIDNFLTQIRNKPKMASGSTIFNSVLIDVGNDLKATFIEPISMIVN